VIGFEIIAKMTHLSFVFGGHLLPIMGGLTVLRVL
jgi:hypothetical protein